MEFNVMDVLKTSQACRRRSRLSSSVGTLPA
jgi:hypothetical protein